MMPETNTRTAHLYPPGPDEPYSASQDLLGWMNNYFKRYGNIYKASVYGSNAYIISAPEYAEHVLRRNWQNYKKGLAIKRIAWLLGNGLMVSEGEFWKRQRRMIQPAFRHNAIGALSHVITAANVALLDRWKEAAREKKSVNATRDISRMVAESVLMAIFGDDYEHVRLHFSILTDETARNLQFADGQWTRGKSPDTFCPVGPRLVPRDEVADPQQLAIRAVLNGEAMQESSTSNMVFGVAELIAYITQAITLEPGDLIATGTPAGVGAFRKPPVFMVPGDEITIEIEGLGSLTNPVAAA